MDRPLLELRRRPVVMLQVKVPQVALVEQLVNNVAESFTLCLFAQKRDILCLLARVPGHLLFQCGGWVLPFLAVPFSLALVQLEVVLGEPRVQGFRHQKLDRAFPPEVLFLMLAAQEVGHLHHQRQRHDPDAQGVHHLRRLV